MTEQPEIGDEELDELFRRADQEIQAELGRRIDVEARLREVLLRAGYTHDQDGEPLT